MRKHKTYVTPQARQFVEATKLHFANLLDASGVTPARLSRMTGIPESTLSRWLNINVSDWMGFDQAAVVANALGVTVREMLAHPGIRSADDERYQVIGPLLAAPIEHVRALTRMYVEIR